jgi:hypothetical protein
VSFGGVTAAGPFADRFMTISCGRSARSVTASAQSCPEGKGNFQRYHFSEVLFATPFTISDLYLFTENFSQLAASVNLKRD